MEKGVPIRSVSRSLDVLKLINRRGSVTLTDIARLAELPYPTACRIVQTLVHEGLVALEADRKRYRPTPLVQALSMGYADDGRLIEAARGPMAELTRQIGWPVTVTTAVGPSVMIRESTYGMSALTFNRYYPGYTFPVLECAAGHVHLAFADEATRDSLLLGLQQMGASSPVMRLFLSGRLGERIRADGYATHDRTMHTENPGKTSSIAAPVLVDGGEQAQLTLSFFASAMPMAEAQRRFCGLLIDAATQVAVHLKSAATPEV